MLLLVVRHGQTQGNTEGRLQGQQSNQALTAEGKNEVALLAPVLAGIPVHALYSSPLLRARETADLLARGVSLPVVENVALLERDFGTLTGKTWDEIAALGHTDLKEKDKALRYDYRRFGGESVEEVKKRIILFLNTLFEAHRAQTVLCATHGGIVRILYEILGVIQPFHNKNAVLHRFEILKRLS